MDVHPTADVLLQSLIFLPQPPKPAPSEPPAPASRGQLCCRAGLTAPSYTHPWPAYPSTHPHLLLFSGDGSRTSKPSYSPPRGQPLPSLPRLRVIPFLGLTIVHRVGALRAASPTWSTKAAIERGLYVLRLTAGPTSYIFACKEVPSYYAKNESSP